MVKLGKLDNMPCDLWRWKTNQNENYTFQSWRRSLHRRRRPSIQTMQYWSLPRYIESQIHCIYISYVVSNWSKISCQPIVFMGQIWKLFHIGNSKIHLVIQHLLSFLYTAQRSNLVLDRHFYIFFNLFKIKLLWSQNKHWDLNKCMFRTEADLKCVK